METQTWLSCHNKFFSAENIIAILSVSSDDFIHAILVVAEQQMRNYSSYVYDEKTKPKIKKDIKILQLQYIYLYIYIYIYIYICMYVY